MDHVSLSRHLCGVSTMNSASPYTVPSFHRAWPGFVRRSVIPFSSPRSTFSGKGGISRTCHSPRRRLAPLLRHTRHRNPPAATQAPLVTQAFDSSAELAESTLARRSNEDEAPDTPPFRWESNWYAVAVAQDLEPKRPHPLTVLGRRMVLWWDSKATVSGSATVGQWRCFLDQCPHRLVPLSEGRIDDQGNLQCSYHGWSFRGDGGCCGIPQAHKEGPENKAVFSPRACAKTFPLKEEKGILFVWPDESEAGKARAQSASLPFPDDLPKDTSQMTATLRVMPYGYETLTENVMDPSHLPFAHHGVGPINRTQGVPYKSISVSSSTEGNGGFSGQYNAGRYNTNVQFKAPGMFGYLGNTPKKADTDRGTNSSLGGAELQGNADPREASAMSAGDVSKAKGGTRGRGPFVSCLFVTPAEPGKSRAIVWEGFGGPRAKPAWQELPRWLVHVFKLYFLDGDAFFLHAQERTHGGYLLKPADEHSPGYFLPTSADRFVVAFRRWLEKTGGGRVSYSPGCSLELPHTSDSKEVVLDRYTSHVKDCTTCLRALGTVKVLQSSAALGAALALVLPLSWSLPLRHVAAGALLAALLGTAYVLLGQLKRQFLFTGYDHASR